MTEPVGAVLSTFTVTAALVKTLPAASVTTTCRSNEPSSPVVSQLAVNGELLSVEIAVQVPAPAGERSNATDGVPGPVLLAVAVSPLVAPRRRASAAGAVSEPVGRVLSTVVVTIELTPTLSASSVTRTRRS